MKKKRILIVDDERNFTQLIKLNLEETGRFEVFMENRGATCLSTAKKFRPNLILLDIIMPDVEGSMVAVQLRNDPKTKNIPIVFLTVAAKKEEVARGGGRIAGYPFIAKPVSLQELVGVIEENIR